MMNRKFLNTVLFGLLTLCMGTFSSCKDYDDDIDGLDNRLTVVEEATKKLQQQVEDAINNGKWIDYVDELTSEFVLHLTNKNGAVETISIPKQGADVMYYFKVAAESEGEGTDSQNVWWYSNDGNNWQYVLDEATHSKMVFNSSSTIKESITISSNESVSYVAIGGEQTTIKVDNTTKLLAEDKENGILVVKLGDLNYTILLEESLFRGLNSVQYRPMQVSSEETLVAVTLKNKEDDSYSYEQPALGYFRCLPAKQFNATASNVSYACKDLHVVTRSGGTELLVPDRNTASVTEDGILKISFQPQEGFEDNTYYKTLLDVTMNGYTVSSDYFSVRKETHFLQDSKCCHVVDGVRKEVDENTTIVFDIDGTYPLDEKIMMGFNTGDEENGLFKSFEELGFTISKKYDLPEGSAFSIIPDEKTGKQYLTKNPAMTGSEVTVTVKWTIEGKEVSKPSVSKNVKFKVESLEMPLSAEDGTALNNLESNYDEEIKINLSHTGIEETDWEEFKNVLNLYETLVLRYRDVINGIEKYLSPVEQVGGNKEEPLKIIYGGENLTFVVAGRASFKEDKQQQLFVMGLKEGKVYPIKTSTGKTLYVQNVKVKYAPSVTPKPAYKIRLDDSNNDGIKILGWGTDENHVDIASLIPYGQSFRLKNTDLTFGEKAFVMGPLKDDEGNVQSGCLLEYDLRAYYDIKPFDLPVLFDIDRDNELIKRNTKWGTDTGSNAPCRFFKSDNVNEGVVMNTKRYDGAVKTNGCEGFKVTGGVPVKWSITSDTNLPEEVKKSGCDRWLLYDPFTFFGMEPGTREHLGNLVEATLTAKVSRSELAEGVVLQELAVTSDASDNVLVKCLPYGKTTLVNWVYLDQASGKLKFEAPETGDPYATDGQGFYYTLQDGPDKDLFQLESTNGVNKSTLKLKNSDSDTSSITELTVKAQYRYDAGSSLQGKVKLKITFTED